jgi:hypothetical protein
MCFPDADGKTAVLGEFKGIQSSIIPDNSSQIVFDTIESGLKLPTDNVFLCRFHIKVEPDSLDNIIWAFSTDIADRPDRISKMPKRYHGMNNRGTIKTDKLKSIVLEDMNKTVDNKEKVADANEKEIKTSGATGVVVSMFVALVCSSI